MNEINLSPAQTERLHAMVDRKVAPLARFATSDYASVPTMLRMPHRRSEWARLGEAERLAVIRGNVEAGLRPHAEYLARTTPALADHPLPPRAVTPAKRAPGTDPARRGSWFVPCAGECGRLLPARPHKPVVRYCGRDCKTAGRSTATILLPDQEHWARLFHKQG